jgi:hypothetical protein
MNELYCIAMCNSLAGTLNYCNEICDENKFREIVKEVTKSDNRRLVVNYTRKVLGQTGTGHFSPIGIMRGGEGERERERERGREREKAIGIEIACVS